MSSGGSATGVCVDVDDTGVAVVTLDGPGRLNAFSAGTRRALGEAYRRCDRDDAIRAVVVTGAGRAFCAGADLSARAGAFDAPGPDFTASPVRPPAWPVRKIVIVAINGPAIGIGLTLALQCDVRLVAEDAQLAIPQVRRGMIADCQAHFTPRQAVGLAVAADVLPAAIEMARDAAINTSPASVALSRRLLWADLDPDEVAHEETLAHHFLMDSADAREGAAAWRERRAPEWRSRASETGDPA